MLKNKKEIDLGHPPEDETLELIMQENEFAFEIEHLNITTGLALRGAYIGITVMIYGCATKGIQTVGLWPLLLCYAICTIDSVQRYVDAGQWMKAAHYGHVTYIGRAIIHLFNLDREKSE